MKKMLCFLTMLTFFALPGFAQKHDYTWLMGYGIFSTPDNPAQCSRLDFNEQPVLIQEHIREMVMQGSNATMSDIDGNLLFYSNGCWIANATDMMMENGDDLNPGPVHDARCAENDLNTYSAGQQSMLALPAPGSGGKYYLLHLGIIYYSDPGFGVLTNVLYATQIDMNANGGLGRVTLKNQPVIEDTLSAGKLTAVKHANGEDWWILTREYLSDTYYSLLLDETELHGPFEQGIGVPATRESDGSGQANFSPDGSQYVDYSPIDGIHLYDFDRSTGLLNNFRHIPIENDGSPGVSGAAFSPNSRYLYVTTSETIMQFDTEAADLAASMVVVAEYDGFVSPTATFFRQLQLGPDCRMYCYCNSCDVIHVIQYPDEAGLACGVAQHAIQLPYPMFRSMPHFPNYRLRPLVAGEVPAPPCELVVAASEAVPREGALRVYPNPAQHELFVETQNQDLHRAQARIYDAVGKLLRAETLDFSQGSASLPLNGLPRGLYFLSVQSEHGAFPAQKFIIE